jgi:hypothetical protein
MVPTFPIKEYQFVIESRTRHSLYSKILLPEFDYNKTVMDKPQFIGFVLRSL